MTEATALELSETYRGQVFVVRTMPSAMTSFVTMRSWSCEATSISTASQQPCSRFGVMKVAAWTRTGTEFAWTPDECAAHARASIDKLIADGKIQANR